MNFGVSATKIIVGVLSLSEIGSGSPVVGHYPSAFGLAYLICTAVHWIAPVRQPLVVPQGFKKWPRPSEPPQKPRLLFRVLSLPRPTRPLSSPISLYAHPRH